MKECAQVKRILSRYLDKETRDADTIMIEAHLDSCSLCRKELSELSRVKRLVSGRERKTLPQNYLVSRLRDAIARARYSEKRFSLTGMGNFARRLIPVPVAAIIISLVFLVLTSTQSVTRYSLEDYMFSGSATTSETALELILGSQN